jgi:hypothetical protein
MQHRRTRGRKALDPKKVTFSQVPIARGSKGEKLVKRFARAFAVTLGLVILASAVSLVPQKNAVGEGSAPVTVVNTPNVNVANTAGNPVPVSGLVAVGNQRTLSGGGFVPVPLDVDVTNGSLPVTGSVSISGTPTVQLSSATNLSLSGPVQVSNPTQTISTPFGPVTQPVPLLVNDGSALNRYRTNCSESGGVFDSSGLCDLGVVPAGQELVIEQVTGHVPGATPGTVQLTLSRVYLQVGSQNYDLATFLTGNDVGVSERVRLYVDPGTDIIVNIIGNCPCRSTFSISGYTVSVP